MEIAQIANLDPDHEHHKVCQKNVKIRQNKSNMSKYVTIHENTSKYVKLCQNTLKYINICQNISK